MNSYTLYLMDNYTLSTQSTQRCNSFCADQHPFLLQWSTLQAHHLEFAGSAFDWHWGLSNSKTKPASSNLMLVLICIHSGSLLKSKSNQEVWIEFIKLLLKLGGIMQEALRAPNCFGFIGNLVWNKRNKTDHIFSWACGAISDLR